LWAQTRLKTVDPLSDPGSITADLVHSAATVAISLQHQPLQGYCLNK
jgi:hypothetical protein